MNQFPTDVIGFINWIIGGGAIVLASVFSSWYLETIPAFITLNRKWKELIVLAIAALIALPATWLSLNPAALTVAMPYLTALLLTFGAWLVMQKAHDINDVTRKNNPQDTLPAGMTIKVETK